jgi:transposase
MKAYSLDLRERVVKALLAGGSIREVSERFGVSHDTVRRYQLRHERGQGLLPLPRLGRAPRVPIEEQESFIAMIRENPNATLLEMSALWQERTGVSLPRATFHDHVRRVGGRFKKESDCE